MIKSKKKINVGVIFGGRSGEHEVSLVSADSVIKGLNKSRFNITQIGITKNGTWITGNKALSMLKSNKIDIKTHCYISPEPKKLADSILNKKLDVVFPVLHGPYGEDGSIQGLFELADIPYVGAGVLASACGMDKAIMKDLFRNSGIPIGKYLAFTKYEWSKNHKAILNKIERYIKYPIFTKPANMGSSVGIMKCRNRKELLTGVKEAFKYDNKIIFEETIFGREIECSVLGNNNVIASLPGELRPKNDFYDYNAKYVTNDTELIIPAKLSKKNINYIQNLAIKSYKSINCTGLARVDFFLKKSGDLIVNEINTMPGFTSHISMYPKLWKVSGISYHKLLDNLIDLALERHREKSKLRNTIKLNNDWYK